MFHRGCTLFLLACAANFMTEPTSFTCPSSIGEELQDHVSDAQTPCRAEVHKCHKCAQSFANAKAVQCHLRFHCRRFQSGSVGSASSGSSACDSSLFASVKRQRTHSEEEHFKNNLEHYRMSSISNFRHRRNLGDATIKAVTEFCSGMLSRVRAEIDRRVKALATTTFADIVASIFEAANTVTSTYKDKKRVPAHFLLFSRSAGCWASAR